MLRSISLLGCALVLGAGLALAQATKTATGTITSITASAVTVNVDGRDMTFAVDAKTRITTPGGGTKARTAQAKGEAGPALTDVLKTGQAVEVRYYDDGLRAESIRTISAVPAPKDLTQPKPLTATGIVSALSGNSLTVKGTAGEWTFSVDEKTTVSGIGLGTASRKLTSEGGAATLTTFVGEGDTVRVTYHDIDNTKHASLIRITAKKK